MTTNNQQGLLPKVWGPHVWEALHSISFGFPINPSDDDINNYYNFFKHFPFVIPCQYCRESCIKFFNEGIVKISRDTFTSRDSITKWVYDLHECVNKKLGVDYQMSYQDVVDKYESFRTKCEPDITDKCIMSPQNKIKAYKRSTIQEAPIIKINHAKFFIDYAIKRGFQDIQLIDTYINTYKNKKNNKELWDKRNNECRDILNEMKLNCINCVETDGEFKDLPTYHEIKLITRLSSSMSKQKLLNVLCKLGFKQKYKLTKIIN